MGIRTPVSSNYAITLGGLEQGVTPLDLAHAYETFATGGLRVSGTLGTNRDGPVGIRKVSLRDDRSNEPITNGRNRPRRKRILPQPVADNVRRILESVIKVGTARDANLGGTPAWGKTGTTENYGDAWFVGATQDMTVAVWVGYPNSLRPMETEYRGRPVAGGTYPAQIWRDFLLSVLQVQKDRLERSCEKFAEKRPDDKPPKRCLEAGLSNDPTSTAPPATSAGPDGGSPTKTTPDDAGTQGDDGPPATGGQDGAPGGVVPPAAPAPAPVPAPVQPPITDGGGATPGGTAPP